MFWWDSPKIMCWIKAQICQDKTLNVHNDDVHDLEMFRHHGEPWERLQWIFIWQILLQDSRCTGHSSIWESREKTAPMETQLRRRYERQGTSQYGSGPTWIRGHVSVISRCLSPSPSSTSTEEHPKRSHFGPWDLKIKALRDTVPFTRKSFRTIQ